MSKSFEDLEYGECHWPLDDNDQWCAAPTSEVYCAEHRQIASRRKGVKTEDFVNQDPLIRWGTRHKMSRIRANSWGVENA